MIDRKFVHFKGPLSLSELAKIGEAVIEKGDMQTSFSSVSTLEDATSQDIAVCHNSKYREALSQTCAGVVLVPPELVEFAPLSVAILSTSVPLKSLSLILNALYEEKKPEYKIHPTAVVHSTAQIEEGTSVGPYTVIEEGVVIGRNCQIGGHVTLHSNVTLGEHCIIEAQVTLSHAFLGNYVRIKSGARIGQKGFGFFMEKGGAHLNQMQLGRVLIGHHVEIGSNTTIDRGSLKDTIIEDFARIDNLVQIAHNVRIGKGAVLVAQVGIAGSTVIGEKSVLGGQVGVAGHLILGAGVMVAAKSGISHNISSQKIVGGIPAVPVKEWRRQVATLKRMSKRTPKE